MSSSTSTKKNQSSSFDNEDVGLMMQALSSPQRSSKHLSAGKRLLPVPSADTKPQSPLQARLQQVPPTGAFVRLLTQPAPRANESWRAEQRLTYSLDLARESLSGKTGLHRHKKKLMPRRRPHLQALRQTGLSQNAGGNACITRSQSRIRPGTATGPPSRNPRPA